MSKLIDRLTIDVYEDGTIQSNSENNCISLEQASYALGSIIREMVLDDTTGIKGDIAKRKVFKSCIDSFSDGLDELSIIASWYNPQETLPFSDKDKVLFYIDKSPKLLFGEYHKEKKVFIEQSTYLAFKPEEIVCWMFMPFPVNFKEEA